MPEDKKPASKVGEAKVKVKITGEHGHEHAGRHYAKGETLEVEPNIAELIEQFGSGSRV